MNARPTVAVFDTKPYDRESLAAREGIDWVFLDFRLEPKTAGGAAGATSACLFVNDDACADAVAGLAECGVRHIAMRCAGHNNLDLAAARAAGLRITRVPSYSPHAVAEHTVALVLALNRKIHRAYNRVRELNFSLSGLVGFDLHGKVAGIYGTGRIGRITAEIFRGFGMEVLASDPFPNSEWALRHGVEYAEPSKVFARADILSLHVPLTPETHYAIRRETLATMKRGVVIVNVSRGDLIKTADLIEALKTGQVGGVALDVYEEEEGVFFEDLSGQVLQDDDLARLLTFPNVLITAHQAFLTREALDEIGRVTAENILRIAQGRPPLEGTTLE